MVNVKTILTDVFPNMNIDAVIEDFPGMRLNNLANIIADIPPYLNEYRKKQPTRNRSQNNRRPVPNTINNNNNNNNKSTDDDLPPAALTSPLTKRLNQLIAELLQVLRRDAGTAWMAPQKEFNNLLTSAFTTLSPELINAILGFARNRHISGFILSFLAFNGLTDCLEGIVPQNNDFWKHLRRTGEQPKRAREKFTKAGYQNVNRILDIVKRYGNVVNFTSLLLNRQFTCGVCFEQRFEDMSVICGAEINAVGTTVHKFCRACVRGHAAAVTHAMPLAESGAGIKCMEHGCNRPIYLANIRQLLSPKVLKRLDDRIIDENIAAAGLSLTRCRSCNYAVEIIEPKEEVHVFFCMNCEKAWCRLCSEPWDDEHFGKTCDKVGGRSANERYWRGVETQLNEIVTRKCHRCNIQFIKSDGCNFMRCRCGATQCYMCRAPNVKHDASHFCEHLHDPARPGCRRCKKCPMFGDADKADAIIVNDVVRQASQVEPQSTNVRFR